jgi:hypothetical protein
VWTDDELGITSLVFAVLVLSSECVLEGLITSSDLRTWVFHAVAVVAAGLALRTRHEAIRQMTMIAGIVAVVNEGLLLTQESISLKFLVPSLVLLFVSVAGLYVIFSPPNRSERVSTSRSVTQHHGPGTNFRPPTTPPQLPKSHGARQKDPYQRVLPVPAGEVLSMGGALMSWYSLALAEWYNLDKWFGLRTVSVGFAELREASSDLDGLHLISRAYLSGGYLVAYLVILGVLGSAILMRTRWSIEHWRPDLFVLVLSPLVLVWQAFLVFELSEDVGGSLVSTGPWVGVLGLGLIAGGSIAQRARP